jgi:hypothetical protein
LRDPAGTMPPHGGALCACGRERRQRMIYLQDAALEVAQNSAHNEDADQELADAIEMGVLDIEEEGARAINIFLPTRHTEADPAICQVAIIKDEVHCDSPFDDKTNAEMIADQIADAHERIAFCQEALTKLGFADLIA